MNVVSAAVQPLYAGQQRVPWSVVSSRSSADDGMSVYAAQAADAAARQAVLAQAAQQAEFMSGFLLAEERERDEQAFEERNRSILAADRQTYVTGIAATTLPTPPAGGY
jgi:hypothetical protein